MNIADFRADLLKEKAYKSYAFGLIQKIKAKWLILAFGVIIAVFVLLFLSGNIPGVN